MINHALRCIFIHVPRTGGSTIEHWLAGRNWWLVDPATKHLTVSQARRIYAPWWDSYFKFSLVRHPLDRSLSMAHYARFFQISKTPDGALEFSQYRRLFGAPVVVEHDYRFHRAETVRHEGHRAGQVYGNILDGALDFVARLETIEADMAWLGERLGVARPFAAVKGLRLEASRGPRPDRAHPATRAAVAALYARDFDRYGYAPDGSVLPWPAVPARAAAVPLSVPAR